MSLLGDEAYDLKYLGLICLGLLVFAKSINGGVPRKKFLLCAAGLLLLLLCIPFQIGAFSRSQAIAMYGGLFFIACFSSCLNLTGRNVYRFALFSLVLVVALLLISYDDCVSQFDYYRSIGRPRLKGCFSNPNSLGGISATIVMLLVVGRRCRTDGRPRRMSFYGALLLAFAALLLSGSRTAWLMIAAFFTLLAYYDLRSKAKFRGDRFVLGLLLCVFAGVVVVSVWYGLEGDVSSGMRLEALKDIEFNGITSFVGIGYVASSGISQVAEQAGGAVDMLWVSGYYKVGLVGITGFLLLIRGSLQPSSLGAKLMMPLAVAFAAALFVQSLGESYLFTVMSFVSATNWLMLSSIQGIARFDHHSVLASF